MSRAASEIDPAVFDAIAPVKAQRQERHAAVVDVILARQVATSALPKPGEVVSLWVAMFGTSLNYNTATKLVKQAQGRLKGAA